MRELNFIEDKGRFGITFMSDDKAEANTVMNAIQRFILKNSNKETKENIDFSICPVGEYEGTIWILINTISLKKYLSDYNLPEIIDILEHSEIDNSIDENIDYQEETYFKTFKKRG